MDYWLVGFYPLPPGRELVVVARTKSRPVVLDPADREMLTALVRTGSHPAQEVRRARILLEFDSATAIVRTDSISVAA